MRRCRTSSGTTLLELTATLVILAVLVGLAAPALGRGLDRLAVRGARDVLAAALARTRVAAVAQGGARVTLDVEDATVRIEDARGAPLEPAIELGRRFGVALAVDDGRDGRIEFRFDGLGLGRSLGATLRLRRGRAEAGLTISGYGRVRSW